MMLLGLACGRSEPEVAATTANPDPTAACGPERAQANTTLLVGGCQRPTSADVRRLALAPWKPAPDPLPLVGAFIEITATGVELDGTAIEAAAFVPMAVSERFDAMRAHDLDTGFVLAIDATATLADVQPVLEALVRAEAPHGALLFGSGTEPRTAPPAHPERYARITAQLEARSPSDRATWLAGEVSTLIAPCASLAAAFGSVATDDPEHRCERLMKAAAESLVACGCPSWEPELISFLQVIGGPADAPRLQADAVELDPKRPTKVERKMTWSSFVAERREPLATLWLTLAD